MKLIRTNLQITWTKDAWDRGVVVVAVEAEAVSPAAHWPGKLGDDAGGAPYYLAFIGGASDIQWMIPHEKQPENLACPGPGGETVAGHRRQGLPLAYSTAATPTVFADLGSGSTKWKAELRQIVTN